MKENKNKANLDMTFVKMAQRKHEIAKEIAERNAIIAERNENAKRYSESVQAKRENEVTTKDMIGYFVSGFLMFALLYVLYIAGACFM